MLSATKIGRTLLLVSPLLAGAVGVMAASAETPGDVQSDSRTPITVNIAARDYILENMRFHLEDVLGVVDALGAGDKDRALSSAKALGTTASKRNTKRPKGLHGRLPEDFVAAARNFHQVFDVLSGSIAAGDDTEKSLSVLASAMQTCVACHASYKLVLEEK